MRRSCLVVLLVGCAPFAMARASDLAGTEFFESRVRPLLVEHCSRCHSAKAARVKAGLVLDRREDLLKGGESGPAIVPGQPGQSRLIEAIRYANPELQMPPRRRLTNEQVADLVRWVELGAPWPGGGSTSAAPAAAPAVESRRATHWAWRRVSAPSLPAVRDEAWARTRVDRFILARLEAAALTPAPPADRRSWLRRVHFALTGLPPTAADVESFVPDRALDAQERVVDRLLASPRFGERWARHWMDLVRYSDTLGNEADMPIPGAWRYRDYLVRAFNGDLSFDRLILEHLAGDLLNDPRRRGDSGDDESVLGTAFFWMSEGKRSPVDLRQAQADTFDNRIDVVGKTFLGVTVACARCHDHKFDPITQADYYGLYGYLKSSRYTQAALNRNELDEAAARLAALRAEIRREAAFALRSQAKDLPRYLLAALRVPPNADPSRIGGIEGLQPERLRRWANALKEPAGDPRHPMFAWRRIAENAAAPSIESMTQRGSEARAQAESAVVKAAATRRPLDHELDDFGRSGYRGWFVEDQAFGPAPLRPGDVLLGNDASRPLATVVRGGAWAHSGHLSPRLQGTLRSPSFTIDRRYLHVLAAGKASRLNVVVEHFVMIQDPLYGRLRLILNEEGPRWHTVDLAMWRGGRAYLEFADTTTQDLHDMGAPAGCGPDGYAAVSRALLSDEGPPAFPAAPSTMALLGDRPVESAVDLAGRYGQVVSDSLAAVADGSLPDLHDVEARAGLLAWLIDHGLLDTDESARARLAPRFLAYKEAEGRVPLPRRAPAMTEGTPEDERIFLRGNPKTAGALVPRRMIEVAAAGGAATAPSVGSGRRELARRFVDPANPLTARVAVNRVWHALFGEGIVRSVDNFGALGDRPTHPELLDDLAGRFVRDGWSIKRLVRELVLSRTFAMASAATPEADAADPDNRLLHRMPVRRLEAEAIRDAVMAVSGTLATRMEGPGVEIFLTPFMDNYAANYGRPSRSGPLDGDGRRSLYIAVRRNFLTPLLVAFDLPPPLATAGRREVSNVPAQALILMNDPFIAQESRRWARRTLAIPGLDPRGRVERMYLDAYARLPSAAERLAALAFIDRHGGVLGIAPDRRRDDERIWSDLAHVLINVKEFVFLK